MLESIYLPNFGNFHQTFWLLPIFFIFGQFWLLFGQKMAKKAEIEKSFFRSLFFCWERSTYQISENFIEQFGFWQFSSFLVSFGCFLARKSQKMPKSKKVFVVEFSFIGKHLHTKFQEILSNGLDFGNFFHFLSIFNIFWPKKPQKMLKSKNSFFVAFSFVGKHLHTKFQKILSTV